MQEAREIQFDLPANLKRKFEYVGGTIRITNEEVNFQPHAVNVQKQPLHILISDIRDVRPTKLFGIFTNGMEVELEDQTTYKFVIGTPWSNKKKEVIDFLQENIASEKDKVDSGSISKGRIE